MKSETGVVPWRGSPRLLATDLVMPEEINSVRIYKKMANTTVLVTPLTSVLSHRGGIGKRTRVGCADRWQGSIMNNAHVVDGTANIMVTLHDGTCLPAELIGGNPRGRTSCCSMLEISI